MKTSQIILLMFIAFLILTTGCIKEYERNDPYISISDYSIEENFDGNQDNILNKGEKARIYISVLNSGGCVAENLKANVTSSNSYIEINDFYSVLNWSNVLIDSISDGLDGVYRPKALVFIEVDNSALLNSNFNLNFDFYDVLDNHWIDSLSLSIQPTSANIILDIVEVIESFSDASYRYFTFYPYLKNIGYSSTQDVWSLSSVSDTLIALTSYGNNPLPYGDIDPGESVKVNSSFAKFKIPIELHTPYTFKMLFEIYDKYENLWCDSTCIKIDP
ncbi:hypothetical protein KKC74_05870 [bacterium]|nr:hypothetical protein [bacterium]MBU1064319.1 hypothetical protein [bacterium]MBU1873329.1 hypothetical protein [bacterium]